MRTKGIAVGTATNWIFNFMVVEITPIEIETLGWRFYIVWIALNAAMSPAIYIFYPESAGRCLEDIDDYYRTSPTLFAFLDKEAISSKQPEKYRIKDEQAIGGKGYSSEFVEIKGGNKDDLTQHHKDVARLKV